MTTNDSCSCTYGIPCHDRCACVMPLSSSGCRRCCRYGSSEQRRSAAKRITAQMAAWEMLVEDYRREVAWRSARDNGGQHVGHTNGLFTSAPPSVMTRFERLLRDAGVTL